MLAEDSLQVWLGQKAWCAFIGGGWIHQVWKLGAAIQFKLVAELLELKEHPGVATGADWRLSLWRCTQA